MPLNLLVDLVFLNPGEITFLLNYVFFIVYQDAQFRDWITNFLQIHCVYE